MIVKHWQKTLLASLIVCGLGLSFAVSAALGPIVPCGQGDDQCTLCDLWQLGANIITFMLWYMAVPGAALMFAVAGVVFLTSYGSEKRVDLAKTIFTNVAIGLLIVFGAWMIVDVLLSLIVGEGSITAPWDVFPTCGST